jgi:hypothetical protein
LDQGFADAQFGWSRKMFQVQLFVHPEEALFDDFKRFVAKSHGLLNVVNRCFDASCNRIYLVLLVDL